MYFLWALFASSVVGDIFTKKKMDVTVGKEKDELVKALTDLKNKKKIYIYLYILFFFFGRNKKI